MSLSLAQSPKEIVYPPNLILEGHVSISPSLHNGARQLALRGQLPDTSRSRGSSCARALATSGTGIILIPVAAALALVNMCDLGILLEEKIHIPHSL